MRISSLLSVCAVSLLLIACEEESDTETQEEMGSMEVATDDAEVATDDAAVDMDAESGQYDEVDDAPVYGDIPVFGPNDIVHAITDRDQQVRLVLRPKDLTMYLSGAVAAGLRSEINERDLKDDLKNALLASIQEVALSEIENAMTDQRKKLSQHRIRYPLNAINSIHYQNGRLWIDLQREKSLSFDDIRTPDDRPVLANFDEWDAEEFVVAFESI